jgi:hypothetical protein
VPRAAVLQTDFSAGALDPRTAARVDLEQYRRGAKTLKNVQPLPTGGVKRRPGTQYLATLPSSARLFPFVHSTDQEYLVVGLGNQLQIYRARGTSSATRTISSVVDYFWFNDFLVTSEPHGFNVGDQVLYESTGSPIPGLTSGDYYYVVQVSPGPGLQIGVPPPKYFQLSETESGYAIDIGAIPGGTHTVVGFGYWTLVETLGGKQMKATGVTGPLIQGHTLSAYKTTALTGVPFFKCTNATDTITVTHVDHGLVNGNIIFVTEGDTASATLLARIPADEINGKHTVTRVDDDVFTYVVDTTAAGTATSAVGPEWREATGATGVVANQDYGVGSLVIDFTTGSGVIGNGDLVADNSNDEYFVNDGGVYDKSPWSEAQLETMDVTQSADTMILVHEDHEPRKLLRTEGEPDPFFTMEPLVLTNIPVRDFKDSLSPVASGANEIQIIKFNVSDAQFRDGDKFVFIMNGRDSGTRTYIHLPGTYRKSGISHINNGVTHYFLQPTNGYLQYNISSALKGTGDTSNNLANTDPDYAGGGLRVDFIGETTAGGVYVSGKQYEFKITFQGADGGRNWELIDFENQSKSGEMDVIGVRDGGVGTEEVWSANRGYPRSVTFHEGRLWFGGSKYLPATMWASKVSDYFNFALGDALDDEAIEFTLATDQVNAIERLHPGRYLEIFTEGAEFFIASTPIVPSQVEIPRQSQYGIAPNTKPASLDGATLYIDSGRRGVRQFLFAYTEEAYQSEDLSVLSGHLFNSPVDIVAHKDTEGDYAFVVNGDGTMAVLNTNRFQGVLTWTKYETRAGDRFERVVSVGDDVVVVVNRLVDGENVRYLERFDSAYFTDAGVRMGDGGSSSVYPEGPGDPSGALHHLRGATVAVRVEGPEDGSPADIDAYDTATLVATDNPNITIKKATVIKNAGRVEVGLPISVEIETLPPTIDIGGGQNVMRTKRISQATVDLYQARNVKVAGYDVNHPAYVQSATYLPLDGVYDTRLRGWSRQPTVLITQTDPLEMTVLGVELEVVD